MDAKKFGEIKIGGLIFEVCELEGDVAVEYNGYIKYDESKIYIREHNSRNMYHALIHELTHALLDHTGYSGLSSDENFVEAFSNAISALIVDNENNKFNIFNPDVFE